MTRDETIRALAVLAAVWPTREITDPTIEGYAAAWEDLPYATVDAAIRRWIKTGRFFPSPAEIRDLTIGGAALPAGAAWTPERAHARYDLGRCSVCGRPAELVMDGHRRYCGDHGDGAVMLPAPRMALVEGGRR